ncbi:binding--dependent transport system inner membrane component family protein [Neorickettsia helminthoeca str. Oregon]|uniref:Binding--dependent transport system inner membrane component family protein n=1 Tax=Neorickettsia helminthoeca str. Oregon TaxID=1286528 RepID=X5H3V4_9RICK|nr:iron ABC transporter permease [Neorickettsia helminthoeca]AHX11246.1 binding--dependent transport system inner membrane component family protein [Neorickettsia helminthoeca str. Oregon]
MQKLVCNGLIFLFFAPTLSLILPSFNSYEPGGVFNWLLGEYVLNTLIILSGVGFLTFVFGVGAACAVTFLRFPGRGLLRVLLFLPLAVPGYITALSYVQFFDFSSDFSLFFREVFGFKHLFRIQSLYGAIFVMSVAFYPYVYMFSLARITSAGNFVAISRSCGKSFLATMLEVVIPVARPAIVGGLTLVLMEVISDFGIMQFFGLQTVVTGIYRKWFLLNDVIGASRLILFLLTFVALMIFLEKTSRQNAFYGNGVVNYDINPCWSLTPLKGMTVTIVLSLLPLFGIGFPIFSLISMTLNATPDYQLFSLIIGSVQIALFASFLTILIAFFFVYMKRKKKIGAALFQMSNLGYSIPGLVVGMGIINFFTSSSSILSYFTFSGFQILTAGTFTALMYSYIFRFLALGCNSIQSGIEKIPSEISWTMRLVGKNSFLDAIQVYSPMLIRYLVSGVILIFLDTLKELPATLLVRPFNFETMSIRVYELVVDERYNDAAVPALIMTAICLAVILFLIKSMYSRGLHNRKKGARIGCLCDVCLSKNEC